MNKISIYILLILIFLGLSRSFSPSAQRTVYIDNEKVLPHYFAGSPLSLILNKSFQAGFLIKTYFQQYKVIHGFKHPETEIVRTSLSFWSHNQKNLGMSLFRRKGPNETESSVVMPPGIIYIGDPSYGSWIIEDSGQKVWIFHRAYRHFPQIFGWGQFRPRYKFYKEAQIYLQNNRTFYGLNNEFGKDGSVTKIAYSKKEEKTQQHQQTFFSNLNKFIDTSWINNRKE